MSRFQIMFLAVLATAGLTYTVVAAPPGQARLDLVLGLGLDGDPVRKNSTALGTTIDDAINTDITPESNALTQLFVVTNLDATNNICIGSVDNSASASDCETLCGTAGSWTDQGYAATMNCTAGNASMGSVVPPGNSRQFRYDGTRCVCMVASGANTDVQVERFAR